MHSLCSHSDVNVATSAQNTCTFIILPVKQRQQNNVRNTDTYKMDGLLLLIRIQKSYTMPHGFDATNKHHAKTYFYGNCAKKVVRTHKLLPDCREKLDKVLCKPLFNIADVNGLSL